MEINRKLKYKKAIIMDVSRMKQLDELLLSFFNKIEYTAIQKSGNKEIHRNLESLLASDNYKKERIIALDIYARSSDYVCNDQVFLSLGKEDYIGLFTEYSETCTGSFYFSQKELAKKFEIEVRTILEKATAPYWIPSKLNLVSLFFSLCVLGYFYIIINQTMYEQKIYIPVGQLILLFLSAIAIVFLVIVLNNLIHNTILPPVAFVWGEEITRSKRMERWRSGIFWSVLVALGISFLTQMLL